MEATTSVSKISYQIEAMRLLKNNKTIIKNYVEGLKKIGMFPKELYYISSFYDANTGSSGCFFENKMDNTYILGYTGTNPITDPIKDIEADIYGICLGQGQHYRSCFNFYKKMANKYGYENIIITGHSLGGNIAQRVAIEYNVKKTIIYNSAPLYIKNGVDLFMDITEENRILYAKRLRRYKKTVRDINLKLESFNGEIIHFSSDEDLLNRILKVLGEDAFYVGKDYIIKDAGIHSIKGIVQKAEGTIQIVCSGENFVSDIFTDKHKNFSYNEKQSLIFLANNKKLAMDYFFKLFFGSEHILNFMENSMEDINISKFVRYVLEKIEYS